MAELRAGRRGLLDPKLDVVFWMLFGAERNRALLLALLNAVLRPPTPIVSVEVQRPDLAALDVEGKEVVLDLRALLESGEQVDVEMQTRSHAALRERGLFYWSRLYSERRALERAFRAAFRRAPQAESARHRRRRARAGGMV
jgi:predicted transposase/invertase (TIGR01784 family)